MGQRRGTKNCQWPTQLQNILGAEFTVYSVVDVFDLIIISPLVFVCVLWAVQSICSINHTDKFLVAAAVYGKSWSSTGVKL